MKWKEGDVIVNDKGDEIIIFGVCGKAVFISEDNSLNKPNNFVFTQELLEQNGWKLQEEQEQLTELTLEQVADKFNIPVEKLRIKE